MPTKTNSKMKLLHEKLPLRVTKETAGSQKKKNGEVPTLKSKETGDCVKCKRFCGSGDHSSSDRFVSLTREVNLLRWVVGLSFRLLEAIPKSSFLSDLFNHPCEAGEKS